MSDYSNYDAETIAILQQATMRMARDHGMMSDMTEEQKQSPTGGQDAMREHNAKLNAAVAEMKRKREAAAEIEKHERQQSRKKNTVKQRVIMPVATAPTQDVIDQLPEHVPEQPVQKAAPKAQTHDATVVPDIAVPDKPKAVKRVQKPVQAHPVVQESSQTVTPSVMNSPKVEYDAFSVINNLPSEGLFYQGPIYGQSLRLIDMLLLNEIRPYNANEIISEILARRVRGIDAADIMSCDEVYILQWLRASSFPDQNIPVRGFTCDNEECGHVVDDRDYAINFKNMKFTTSVNPRDVAAKFAEGVVSIELSDGTQCDIYPRRRYHDIQLAEWQNKYYEEHEDFPKEALVTIVNTALILEIGGCDTIDDKLKFMSNLTREDSRYLFETLRSSEIVTTTEINHTCPKCGRRVTTPYPFRLDDYISGL